MIKNASKSTIISSSFEKLNTLESIKGLLRENSPKTVVFKSRFGIHTFFMKFNIDVVVLNNKNEVVFIRENIGRGKIIFWNFKFDTVIELPSGTIKKSQTELKDRIKFIL